MAPYCITKPFFVDFTYFRFLEFFHAGKELKELESELPSDVHLVEYHLDGDLMVSGIRGYRMVDIFDALFDHGAEVVSIIQGYGRIKPKLFGIQQANEEE